MFLPQRDVELPGLLPLVFTRRVASDYRCGWWFGPTWASTIDQRLEVDQHGIVFVTEDGQLLTYPHPEGPKIPVMPETGPRWPLTRQDNGAYRIDNPLTGHTRHFACPAGGVALLLRITDRNQHTITFDYDERGAPLAVRHSGGYHLRLTTDEGRVTGLSLTGAAEDGSDVVIKRYGYTDGNLTETVNSSGLPLRFTYDERLRVTSWTDTNNRSYAYTYDEHDRCTAEGGQAGHLTITLDYDGTDPAWPDCRITTLTTAEGATTRFVINDNSQVIAEIDALGAVTRSEYDRYHRLLSWTDVLDRTTRFENNENDQPFRIVRPDGCESRAEYNELGLPVTITGPDSLTHHLTYDGRGNRTSATDPAGNTTRFTYDAAGRITSVIDPLDNVTVVRCDPAGLPVSVTDPSGGTTRCARNPFGRPTDITDAAGAVTRLDWTVEGLLARRTAPDGSAETWEYDGEGNRIAHVDAMGSVSRYQYTHFDLLSARTGPDGIRYEFAYDAGLRLTEVTNPQGLTWKYTYDPAGRLTAEKDFDDRILTYTHDPVGRLSSRTNSLGQTTRYERDVLGRVTRKDAAGQVTTFTYDAVGELVTAAGPDATVALQRDRLGRLVSESVNGRTVTYAHDELGRLTAQSVTGRDGRSVQHRSYHYRADGNLAGIDDQLAGPPRFDLDAAGRVTAVHAPNWSETYAYDQAGNQAHAMWPAAHPSHEATGPRSYTGTRITHAGRVRYEHDELGRVTLRQRTRLSRKPDTWQLHLGRGGSSDGGPDTRRHGVALRLRPAGAPNGQAADGHRWRNGRRAH
jgi:YD repeat-containing protein